MNIIRILIFASLAAAAAASVLVCPPVNRSRLASSLLMDRLTAPAAEPEAVAWALLAEASEICFGRAEAGEYGACRPSRGSTPRRRMAGEAIAIARELASRIAPARSPFAILAAAHRLETLCARAGASGGAPPSASPDLPESSQAARIRSLDGATAADRRSLIVPYLKRLNEAASGCRELPSGHGIARAGRPGADSAPEPLVSSVEPPAGRTAESATGLVSVSSSEAAGSIPARATVGAAIESPGAQEPAPAPSPKSVPPVPASAPRLEVSFEGGSRRYRERVRRWAEVFGREARRLESSRAALQAEIRRHTIARSRRACRSFAAQLARFDRDAAALAPSRSLGLRIERALGQYRRGATECVSGHSAAAFAYMSEGDREWREAAARAARIFHPRPLRTRAGGVEVEGRGR